MDHQSPRWTPESESLYFSSLGPGENGGAIWSIPALGGSPRQYIQYLLPGILVQTLVFITVYTGVGLNTDIRKGLYDRFRSIPMWQPAPLFGALAGDVLR